MMEHAVWHLTPGQFKVWATILVMASFKEAAWWDGQQRVAIAPGSFVTSQDHLAKAADVGRQVVRGALLSLERIGSIRAKITTKRWTLVEIVNWPTYQGDDVQGNPEPNQPATNRQPTGNHILRREEGKKERKELSEGSAVRSASPPEAAPLTAPGNGDGRDPAHEGTLKCTTKDPAPLSVTYMTWAGKETQARPYIVARLDCPDGELVTNISTLVAFGIGREEIGSALAMLGKRWPGTEINRA
jgi:hypothetical protein